MNTPTYMRPRIPSWLWTVLILTALGVALVFAGRSAVGMIRDGERQRVYNEATMWANATTSFQRDAWLRERDSLRAETSKRDTVLQRRIKVVHDTSWLPADTSSPVRLDACRAQLDTLATECEAFRATALAAIATSDSLHKADSARAVDLIMRGVAASDSVRMKSVQLSRSPSWGTVTKGVGVGALVGVGLCLFFCP